MNQIYNLYAKEKAIIEYFLVSVYGSHNEIYIDFSQKMEL
jgi:hypothetical protein